MLKGITYRKKLKLLGAAALITAVICYKFSFSKTFSEYRTYKRSKIQNVSVEEQHFNLAELESRQRLLNDILNKYRLDTESGPGNMLNVIGEQCQQFGLKLKEYKPGLFADNDTMQMLTRTATVEGSFRDCLMLVHSMETNYDVGRVSSVLFKSYSDARNENTWLTCTIHIQNLVYDDHQNK